MKKSFKLIKEYPGSPTLNTVIVDTQIISLSGRINTYAISGKDKNYNTVIFRISNPEYYPEFWEEIIEKDYKILTLASFCSIKPAITNVSNYNDEFIEAMLKCDNARIYSVKRLSDGEVFTVGDKIRFIDESLEETYPVRVIQGFLIKDNTILSINSDVGVEILLKNLTHMKQPLFTTEDGVDIFEDDKYVMLDKSNWCIDITGGLGLNKKDYRIYFSTKETAEEYILMNKPCLSLNDVATIYRGINKTTNNKPSSQANKLKELVKTKIK